MSSLAVGPLKKVIKYIVALRRESHTCKQYFQWHEKHTVMWVCVRCIEQTEGSLYLFWRTEMFSQSNGCKVMEVWEDMSCVGNCAPFTWLVSRKWRGSAGQGCVKFSVPVRSPEGHAQLEIRSRASPRKSRFGNHHHVFVVQHLKKERVCRLGRGLNQNPRTTHVKGPAE